MLDSATGWPLTGLISGHEVRRHDYQIQIGRNHAGVFSLGCGVPWGIAFDGINIWVADTEAKGWWLSSGPVTEHPRYDSSWRAVTYGVVFDGVYVWVTTGNYVAQLRVSDGALLHTFNTPATQAGIAFDGANALVAEYDGSSVSKNERASARVRKPRCKTMTRATYSTGCTLNLFTGH